MRVDHLHELEAALTHRPALLDVEIYPSRQDDDRAVVARAAQFGYRQVARVDETLSEGNLVWQGEQIRRIRFTLVPDGNSSRMAGREAPRSPEGRGAPAEAGAFATVIAEVRAAVTAGPHSDWLRHTVQSQAGGLFKSAPAPSPSCPDGHLGCTLQTSVKRGKVIESVYARPIVLLWEYTVRDDAGYGPARPRVVSIFVDSQGYLVPTAEPHARTWHTGDADLHEFVTSGHRHLDELAPSHIVNTMPTTIIDIPGQIRINAFGDRNDRLSAISSRASG